MFGRAERQFPVSCDRRTNGRI